MAAIGPFMRQVRHAYWWIQAMWAMLSWYRLCYKYMLQLTPAGRGGWIRKGSSLNITNITNIHESYLWFLPDSYLTKPRLLMLLNTVISHPAKGWWPSIARFWQRWSIPNRVLVYDDDAYHMTLMIHAATPKHCRDAASLWHDVSLCSYLWSITLLTRSYALTCYSTCMQQWWLLYWLRLYPIIPVIHCYHATVPD